MTEPFRFEGNERHIRADLCKNEIRRSADIMVVTPNDNLLDAVNDKFTFTKSLAWQSEIVKEILKEINETVCADNKFSNEEFHNYVKNRIQGVLNSNYGHIECSSI